MKETNQAPAFSEEELRYLRLLAKDYPTIPQVCAELMNLSAIYNLPKGTEHFMSDLHGESEAFAHLLNNCSGVIREKVDAIFGQTMTEGERRNFCSLIYYPEEKMEEVRAAGELDAAWYLNNLRRLTELSRSVASKYTRAKVRKALPVDFAYVLDELLHTSGEEHDKQEYYKHILSAAIELGQGAAFVVALCSLIKRMAVDRLHIVGDIFDRGRHADRILDLLMHHHNVDIEWGNHDIVWMGAAAGNLACMACVINNALQYNTLGLLENTYGISLRNLMAFAQENYAGSTWFLPRNPDDLYYIKNNLDTLSRTHKAIAIIQFKLEGQIIKRHPEYHMDHRLLLDKINKKKQSVVVDGVEYPLNDSQFPTLDPKNPYALSPGEEALMAEISKAFRRSQPLRRHMEFLYSHGSLYRIYNSNLLFHGCIPMNDDGTFRQLRVQDGLEVSGRAYMDYCDKMARRAYFSGDSMAVDFMWYLWCGRNSPLFGRDKITTFERYFIADRSTWKEGKNPYYSLVEREEVCENILREFGLDPADAHIVNGHVPVRTLHGESPIKAGGRYLLIDGGFCKAYHDKTGIAGYTLIFSSHGMRLISHAPFEGKDAAVRENKDILHATDVIFERMPKRLLVRNTDEGRRIREKMIDLNFLLMAYRRGVIAGG